MREGFKHANLREWADEHRGELIWAGLSLVRAWLAADRPKPQVKPLGSYEEWSLIVGGILENAGISGFLGNLNEFYEASDLESQVWQQLVGLWHQRYEQREVGVADLYELALSCDGFDLEGRGDRAQRISFSRQLAAMRDRVIDQHRIVKAGKKHNAQQWKLLPV